MVANCSGMVDTTHSGRIVGLGQALFIGRHYWQGRQLECMFTSSEKHQAIFSDLYYAQVEYGLQFFGCLDHGIL